MTRGRLRARLACLLVGLCVALSVFATSAGGLAAANPWSGKWRLKEYAKSDLPFADGDTVMLLVQKGTSVTGHFAFRYKADRGFGTVPCWSDTGGFLKGTADGRKLTGRLVWPAGHGSPRTIAPFEAMLSRTGRAFELRSVSPQGACAGQGVPLSFVAVRDTK